MTVATENTTEQTAIQEKPDLINKSEAQANLTPSEDTKEDPNWRAFREARKKDRAEKEAAEKRAAEKEAEAAALRAAMEAAFAKSPSNYNPNERMIEPEETEDERIEKKVQAALAQREEADRIARLQREQQEYPQRLVKDYSDFHQTVSNENLDYLEYHYPEVAGPLKRLPDDYSKWADIYRAVKKFVPNNTTARQEAVRAENNFSKPKSISTTSITQPQEAGGSMRLSDERKAANWERMQKSLRSLS